jgi:suppressor for copper-sensitivity B
LLATASLAFAQANKPLDFERDFGLGNLPDIGGPQLGGQDVVFSAFIIPARDGAPPMLAVQADVAQGWHIYSITQPDKGPMRTEITVDKSPHFELGGKFVADTSPAVSRKEDFWPGVDVEEHHGIVTWLAPLKLVADAKLESLEINGRISGQLCTDNLGTCRPFEFLGDDADRWTAKLATAEQLASVKAIPAAVEVAEPAAETGATRLGQYAARDSNPIIRGHIEPKIVAPGQTAKLVLSLEPAAGWHTYLRTDEVPASGSRPTLISLTQTSGLNPHAPVSETPVVVKGALQHYDGPTTWTVQFPIPQNAQPGDYKIEGLLGYQVCSDKTCLGPAAVKFQGVIAIGSSAESGQMPIGFDESDYATAMKSLATRVAWMGGSGGVIDYAAIQEHARAERDAKPLIFWIFTAMLAGFILNFMPCVLPVIGLKVMSFVQQAGEDRKQIFLLNFVYALGMLSVFWVLATLAAFANFTWSDQFGSVAFNVSLAAVVFLFALSFLGVWEVPIPGFVGSGSASAVAEREGLGGAFAKGILTTLLATPCTGPMLGPALGWAVGKPPLFSYLIFTCVGLGMALPYIIIGAQPRLVKFLPRPGAWMETFKNIMGFVLMATVIFILSYLPIEYVVPTVAFCIGLWAACWWIGRKQHEGLDPYKMVVNWAGAATFAAIIGMVSFLWLSDVMRGRLETLITDRVNDALKATLSTETAPATTTVQSEKSPHELPWEKFTQEALEKHIAAGRTVFVDFTADWCFVCKDNEQRALNTSPVRELVDEHGIVTLKADLTRRPPELVEMMRKLGHPSGALPFYAVFPAERPQEATFFSGSQTQAYFLDQLKAAGPSQSPAAGRTAMMPTP